MIEKKIRPMQCRVMTCFELCQLNLLPWPCQRFLNNNRVEEIKKKQRDFIARNRQAIFPGTIVMVDYHNNSQVNSITQIVPSGHYVIDGQHRYRAILDMVNEPGVRDIVNSAQITLQWITMIDNIEAVNEIYRLCNDNYVNDVNRTYQILTHQQVDSGHSIQGFQNVNNLNNPLNYGHDNHNNRNNQVDQISYPLAQVTIPTQQNVPNGVTLLTPAFAANPVASPASNPSFPQNNPWTLSLPTLPLPSAQSNNLNNPNNQIDPLILQSPKVRQILTLFVDKYGKQIKSSSQITTKIRSPYIDIVTLERKLLSSRWLVNYSDEEFMASVSRSNDDYYNHLNAMKDYGKINRCIGGFFLVYQGANCSWIDKLMIHIR